MRALSLSLVLLVACGSDSGGPPPKDIGFEKPKAALHANSTTMGVVTESTQLLQEFWGVVFGSG